MGPAQRFLRHPNPFASKSIRLQEQFWIFTGEDRRIRVRRNSRSNSGFSQAKITEKVKKRDSPGKLGGWYSFWNPSHLFGWCPLSQQNSSCSGLCHSRILLWGGGTPSVSVACPHRGNCPTHWFTKGVPAPSGTRNLVAWNSEPGISNCDNLVFPIIPSKIGLIPEDFPETSATKMENARDPPTRGHPNAPKSA